ncbi:hypothetical protein ACKUER_25135, partial [Escherichia coli]
AANDCSTSASGGGEPAGTGPALRSTGCRYGGTGGGWPDVAQRRPGRGAAGRWSMAGPAVALARPRGGKGAAVEPGLD